MTALPLFFELWGGTVAVVAVGAALRNRPGHRDDPSAWVAAMDSYLDDKLRHQHYSNEGHVCAPGCQRMKLTEDWREGI